MEAKRLEIATLICADHTTPNIVKRLRVTHQTVYNVHKRLEDIGSLKDRPWTGRPVKLTPKAAKKAFEAKPTMSMAEFARKKAIA